VTDHLRVKGTGYVLKRWLLSNKPPPCSHPVSAGEGEGPPQDGDEFESAVIATVALTILALGRQITDTTGCLVTILVGSCREPDYGD
jgi:hypothetical protein